MNFLQQKKQLLLAVFLSGFNLVLSAQSWSQNELNAANTVKGISALTQEEKETIKYVNLARMYPKKFAELEVKNHFGGERFGNYLRDSPYRQSLLKDLWGMSPVDPVYFLQEMQDLASCFARESGARGITGHTRINCAKGFNGECCSYGHATGKEIVLQLLIDHDVPSLGHRKICLNSQYLSIGVSIAAHTKYEYCAVLDFKIEPQQMREEGNSQNSKSIFNLKISPTNGIMRKNDSYDQDMTNKSKYTTLKESRYIIALGIGASILTNEKFEIISTDAKKIPLNLNGVLGWRLSRKKHLITIGLFLEQFWLPESDSTGKYEPFYHQNQSRTEFEAGILAFNFLRLSAGIGINNTFYNEPFLQYQTLSGGISLGNKHIKMNMTNSFLYNNTAKHLFRTTLSLSYCFL